jgi:WD40 repeat protein
VWDVATGKRLRVWDLEPQAQFTAVAFSPDGLRIAVGQASPGRETITIHDAATGKILHKLVAPGGGAWGLAFSADGRALAAGEWKGAVCVWDAATGRLRRRFTGHTGPVSALAFSPDGRLLVSGCDGGDPTLLVWDLTKTAERNDR